MYQNLTLSERIHSWFILRCRTSLPRRSFLSIYPYLSILIHTYQMNPYLSNEHQRKAKAIRCCSAIHGDSFFRISSWPLSIPTRSQLVQAGECCLLPSYRLPSKAYAKNCPYYWSSDNSDLPSLSQASPRPYLPSPLGLKKWPTFRKEKHAMFGRRNIGQGTALWRPTVEWTRIVNRKLRKCLPHFASFCPRKNMKKRVWPREEVDWRRKLGYFESTAISQVRHVCNPSC